MSGNRPATSDIDIDLTQLFRGLLAKWPRILLVALVLAALAFAYATLATPLYRSETRLLIETRESVFTRPGNAVESSAPILDEEGVTSQVEVISSADILRQVARDLDLASRQEFRGSEGLSTIGNLMMLLGLRSDPAESTIEQRVLDAMRERLVVYRIDRSRVIVVQFSSSDPALAAAVPNAIADAYINVQRQAMLLSNEDATEWLEPEISDLRERVREAEQRVAEYRSQSDLLQGQGNAVLSTQQLSELSTELTRIRATRSSAEARAAGIREAMDAGISAESLPDVLASPMIQRLRDRQVEIRSQIAELSTTLLDNHPRMRALRSQLVEIDGQMRAEMGRVLDATQREASASRAIEESLMADVNGLKAAAAQAGEDEVGLRALEREASSQRALLESYLTRFREAASRADRNYLPVDARVFARATPPYESYFPRKVPIVGAAFVAGLLLMTVLTLLQELFSGRAMRAAPGRMYEPVERVAMPLAATGGTLMAGPGMEASWQFDDTGEGYGPIEVNQVPASGAADHDQLSVAQAAERLIVGGFARAIFVSPEGDEATAASVMVAREVADAGLRVLFLDLSGTGAPSASMLDSLHFPGITNLLASEAQFSDVIRGDLYSDCHVIPVGTGDNDRAARGLERLPIIMSSLTTAYDVVIVECGATGPAGVARVADEGACLLVAVIEPEDADVARAQDEFAASDFGEILRVSPAGFEPPAPSGRSVA